MAANPIVTQKAIEILGIDWGFGQWLLAACVPSFVAALILPWSMRLVSPSTVDVAAVRAVIDQDLQAYVRPPRRPRWCTAHHARLIDPAPRQRRKDAAGSIPRSMGRTSRREWALIAILTSCLILWMTSLWSHFDATSIGAQVRAARHPDLAHTNKRSLWPAVAFLLMGRTAFSSLAAIAATVALVVTGAISWDDILRNEDGWDTVVWLGGLVSMAGACRRRPPA